MPDPPPLEGRTLLVFESRRANEIARLIRSFGGQVIAVPAMREVALRENDSTRAFLAALRARQLDVVVFTTGVGTKALIETLSPACSIDEVRALLQAPRVVARGPKPRAALRALGIGVDFTVGEPNTWRQTLETLRSEVGLRDQHVAIQEYGRPNHALRAALADGGALPSDVAVYRWALPHDLAPLRQASHDLCAGKPDIAVFTSGQQCVHLFQIASELGQADELRTSARRVAIASIGPICSEVLAEHGLKVDIEPARPKMGPLVRAIAEQAPAILARMGRQAGARPAVGRWR